MTQHGGLQRQAVGALALMLAGAGLCAAQVGQAGHAGRVSGPAPASMEGGAPHPADMPANEAPNGSFKSFHGKLKKYIDEYTGPEFIDAMKGVGWYGWDLARPCADDPTNCPTGNMNGMMRVQAIGDAHQVPKRGSKHGIVVGRIENIGAYTDAATGLPSHTAVPAQYYYIAQRVKNQKEARVRIAMITFDPSGTAKDDITLFESKKPYQECADVDPKHPHHIKRKHARGDFRTCDMEPPPDQEPTAGEPRSAGRPSVREALEIAWFSCNEGCCTAQWPPSGRNFFMRRSTKR